MSTFKSSIKIPTYPKQSESFNRRLGGFFRECWQRMRVMHAEFEHGQLVDSSRFTCGREQL
jgi:hypothetical protein